MKHYYQIEGLLRNNLGDIIQGIAAKQFLPTNATAIDRERPDLVGSEAGFLIANGWYQHDFDHYPPPNQITPFFISVHIAKSDFIKSSKIRSYFKENSPIGCRDTKTLWLLRGFGIPAYYSGCLTLTLNPPVSQSVQKTTVLWVDNIDHPLPYPVEKKIEELIPNEISKINHNPISINSSFEEYNELNLNRANELLATYKNAKLVLTSKIHCALPCIAMGVPVILIHPNPKDPRLEILHKLIKVISYEELMNLTRLPEPTINEWNLFKIQKKLTHLTRLAVKYHSNPFHQKGETILQFKKMYYQLVSNLTSAFIKLCWKTGIYKNQLERIFGLSYLNEKN
jgi:hypothetical protein